MNMTRVCERHSQFIVLWAYACVVFRYGIYSFSLAREKYGFIVLALQQTGIDFRFLMPKTKLQRHTHRWVRHKLTDIKLSIVAYMEVAYFIVKKMMIILLNIISLFYLVLIENTFGRRIKRCRVFRMIFVPKQLSENNTKFEFSIAFHIVLLGVIFYKS